MGEDGLVLIEVRATFRVPKQVGIVYRDAHAAGGTYDEHASTLRWLLQQARSGVVTVQPEARD
jgi:hypothetical protein